MPSNSHTHPSDPSPEASPAAAALRDSSGRTDSPLFSRRRRASLAAVGITASLALALSACAGSAGSAGDGGSGGNEGFAYDAPQDEVNAIVEDLDPVTLVFQPPAASENSVMAPAGAVLKEIIEERSNGKIEVEMVWGQAIAGYAEIHDALADGRVDIAWTLPIYQPAEFPALDNLGTAMAGLPASPYAGELVASAVGTELGWTNESVLATYEEKGLVPLTPLGASGGYYSVCNKPVSSSDDWQGTQVRIASTAQSAQVQHLGGAPVSMEYTETFEALQRGTVDCTLGQLVPSAEAGILEVAPHIGYTTDYSFSRSPGAYLAGSSFEQLPLAYQQIIFDSNALAVAGGMQSVIGGNAEAISQAKEMVGSVEPFDDDIQEAIGSYSEELTADAVANGHIDEDIAATIAEAGERWAKRVEELGYVDEGSTQDLDEWYDTETGFSDYAKANYEEGAAMDHRPS